MTSIAATLSIDQRGPCALYIITDSRITWGRPASRWDAGRKTFASATSPDIFGYCGDAFFPPAIIQQVLQQIDLGLMQTSGVDATARHTCFCQAFEEAVSSWMDAPMQAFSILHGARNGEGMSSTFHLWLIRFSPSTRRWYSEARNITNTHSHMMHIDGSGRNAVENSRDLWNQTDVKNTSRAAVQAFCDALEHRSDPFSGGPPQLVGLWRVGNGRTFGFVWSSRTYLSGLAALGDANFSNVSCFNKDFERCDGKTGLILKGAKRHSRPIKQP